MIEEVSMDSEEPGDYFPSSEIFNEHVLQKAKLEEEELKCAHSINNYVQTQKSRNESFCPSVWDGAYCWPETPPGTLAEIHCPAYIHGFNPSALASRMCTADGTWWWSDERNGTWSNYTLCGDRELSAETVSAFQSHLKNIKHIAQAGYSLSLLLLLAAFSVLALMKKLRCPRNSLHMQLFLSFIFRAFLSLMRQPLIGIADDDDGGTSALVTNDNTFCKLFMSFWQYSLMANYCWILMEGLYLHNLIFMSMFTDASGIMKYVVFGWGFPILFVVPWVVVKRIFENNLCWTVNENPAFFWIIRGPITVSIIINFVFFINITRVLFLKMFSSQAIQTRRYRYRKWFKSTLVLVPLFGVHYAILLSVSLAASFGEAIELTWLYIDQTFASFQGSFVALLYCFLNGEVQAEMKKLTRIFRSNPDGAPGALHSHHSLLTQSLTYISRARSSVQSLHSAAGDRGSCHLATVPRVGLSSLECSPHPSPKTIATLSTKWGSSSYPTKSAAELIGKSFDQAEKSKVVVGCEEISNCYFLLDSRDIMPQDSQAAATGFKSCSEASQESKL